MNGSLKAQFLKLALGDCVLFCLTHQGNQTI